MTVAQAFLLPVFLHVLLTATVGIVTVRARIASVVAGETRIKDIALAADAWPPRVRALGNNFDNQFDLPVAWYASCALVLATGMVDWVAVALSWLFLATRLVHAFIHTGANRVPARMYAYLAGFSAVFCQWAWFALRLYAIG